MTDQAFDDARSDAFAERMMDMLNSAGTVLMTSTGHQAALFDSMARMPTATSLQIADAAGLQERYVREWLGALVTASVIEYDPEGGTNALPAEQAAWLTRAARSSNLAVQAQFIPLLAEVEVPLIECFRSGGGVPYSQYPRFQRMMAEDSGAVRDAALIDGIQPLVDGLPARLHAGTEVLDVGCGREHAINLMAQEFPNSSFTGFDVSEEGIQAEREEAQRLGLTNAKFEARDVVGLQEHGRFGLVTAFDAIHDQATPDRVLAGIASALRPVGVFLMVDIGASNHAHENIVFPLATFLHTISCTHCMTVSLALDGPGLGVMWGEQTALQTLADGGSGHLDVKRIRENLVNNYYVATQDTAA